MYMYMYMYIYICKLCVCIHTTWISCLSLNTFFPENMPSPVAAFVKPEKTELRTSLEMQLRQNGSAWQQPRISATKM